MTCASSVHATASAARRYDLSASGHICRVPFCRFRASRAQRPPPPPSRARSQLYAQMHKFVSLKIETSRTNSSISRTAHSREACTEICVQLRQ
eukprot:5371696-Pleurochrysis_carterae.AAC.2